MEIDIKNKENIIWKAREQELDYYSGFIKALDIVKPLLKGKDYKKLLEEKFQFASNKFDLPKYLQYAVELSVIRYFAENYKDSFKYEYKANSSNAKDVDCRIGDNGFTYNIEVKTPELEKKDANVSPGLLGRSLGQLPVNAFINTPSEMDKALGNKEGASKMVNLNLKLKDYLVESNKKFSKTEPDEANVLIVGLDDIFEIIIWANYLTNAGNGGLFTSNSFYDYTKYCNVDIVVLTNLQYKHLHALENKCENHWDLMHSFSVMYHNPRNPKKKDAMLNFLSACPNFNNESSTYAVKREDESEIAKRLFRLKFFVEDELEKERGIYLFDKSKAGNNV